MSDTRLLEEFTARAILCGTIVSVARSAAEAQGLLSELIRSRDIRVAVKSGSGLADLLGLNHSLQHHGVKVTETELVGFIVQLSKGKDVPLERVAGMISSAAGHQVEAEPSAILSAARMVLKEAYRAADLGISEADFGIVETGTLVTLEHAAGARLAAVLPHLHLSLLDYGCIVATLADAAEKIKAESGGIPGRKLTAFISQIARQNRPGNGYRTAVSGHERPIEEHILIIRS
jgi:L-lactate dehydrogenase complex protein LldF